MILASSISSRFPAGRLSSAIFHFAVVAIALAPTQLDADDSLITDRPDFTESTPTIAPGRVQLELGASLSRIAGEETLEAGELLLRIGLAEAIELRLAPGSWVDGPGEDGLADAGVGIKIRLHEPKSPGLLPATSLLFTTTIPTGETGIGGEELAPELKLLFAWDLPGGLSLGSNLGIAKVPADGGRFDQALASITVGAPLADQWGVFVELYGIFPPEHHADDATFADAGVTWLLHDDLQLDLRVGRQLSGEQLETTVGIGAAMRW